MKGKEEKDKIKKRIEIKNRKNDKYVFTKIRIQLLEKLDLPTHD